MVQLLTILNVVDSSGVRKVKCIKVIGSFKKKIASMGDQIAVVIKKIDHKKNKVKKGARVSKSRKIYKGAIEGAVRRALVVRSAQRFYRAPGIFIKFGENACLIINRKKVPVTNRIKGPVLRETCLQYPSLGSIATYIL